MLLLAALPAAGGAVPVGGRVVDEHGEPLAGVRVELLPDLPPFEHHRLLLAGAGGPEPAAVARTDADGRYELTAPKPGFWVVRASADGRLPAREVLAPLLAARELKPLALSAGRGITVRVRDPRGQPVPGALVAALPAPWLGREAHLPAWGLELVTFARTGRDGRAVVPRSPDHATHVEVLAPGHALAAGEAAADSLELRLEPGTERAVRVLEADGSGAAGAVVGLGRLGLPAVRTGEAGAARVRAPAAAEVLLHARSAAGDWTARLLPPPAPPAEAEEAAAEAAGPGPAAAAGPVTVPPAATAEPARPGEEALSGAAAAATLPPAAAPGEVEGGGATSPPAATGPERGAASDGGPSAAPPPTAFELRFPPARSVDVRVVDAETGRPVADSLVWAPHPLDVRAEAMSEGSHRLRLPQVVGTSAGYGALVAAAAPGYQRNGTEAAGSRTAAGAAAEPLSIELRAERRQGGRVVDAAGEPVAGALISAWPLGYNGDQLRQVARSAADGTFLIAGLAPENRYTVVVERRGFARLRTLIAVPVEGEAEPVELVLEPGLAAAGRVLDAAGRPVPGATVALAPAAGEGPAASFAAMSFGEEGPRGPHRAAAGTDGRFRLTGLAAGRYDVEARAAGFAPLRVPGIEVAPPPGAGDEPADLGTLYLEPGEEVRGRVVDPQGEPVAGAQVYRLDTGHPDPGVVSDEQGRFTLTDLPATGSITISVYRSGYSSIQLPLDLPVDRPVEAVLHPAAGVAGVVVGPDGEPFEGATISISVETAGGSGGRHTRRSEEGGRFTSDVQAGTVRVAAFAEGMSSGTPVLLELATGQRRDDLRLELTRGGTVQGRITGRGGRPVVGAWVDYGDGMGGQTITDLEGNYRLGGMSPGRQRLRIHHRDYPPAERELEVGVGSQTLDIRLDPGAEILVRALDEAGEPVAGARVSLGRGGSSSHGGGDLTGADGGFRLRGLEPGRYWVQLDRPGYASARSEEMEVASGGEAEIELVMGRGAVVRGRLLGLDPTELGSLEIILLGAEGQRAGPGLVSHDGAYRVEGATPGEWLLVVSRPSGWADRRVRLDVGAAESPVVVDVDFGTGHTLTGTARLGTAPWAEAQVNVNCSGAHGGSTTDPGGRFVVRGLPAGRCRVRVHGQRPDGGRPLRADLPVDLAGDQEIEIAVPAPPAAP